MRYCVIFAHTHTHMHYYINPVSVFDRVFFTPVLWVPVLSAFIRVSEIFTRTTVSPCRLLIIIIIIKNTPLPPKSLSKHRWRSGNIRRVYTKTRRIWFGRFYEKRINENRFYFSNGPFFGGETAAADRKPALASIIHGMVRIFRRVYGKSRIRCAESNFSSTVVFYYITIVKKKSTKIFA